MHNMFTPIESELASLTSKQRNAFFQLCDCRRTGGPVTADGIFQTNSYGLGNTMQAGIFLIISRVNHSCLPNCTHYWNGDLRIKNVCAGRDVKCGEELTLSDLRHQTTDWDDRQAALKFKHNFVCGCEVGTKNPEDQRHVSALSPPHLTPSPCALHSESKACSDSLPNTVWS